MAVKQPSVLDADDLNDADEEILDALREGRGTPSYLAERLGRNRSYVSQRLKRLAEHDILDRLGTGLYELADDPRAGEADERPNVDTREIVDDWLREHYGIGVGDVPAAQESFEALLLAKQDVDQEAIDAALNELGGALDVEVPEDA